MTVNVVARNLSLEAKNVKLEFSNQHGYTFRISMNHEKSARKLLKEMNIVDTKKDGVRFRNVKLDQLNREYLKIASEFENQQQHVMKEMYNITCSKCHTLPNALQKIRTDIFPQHLQIL